MFLSFLGYNFYGWISDRTGRKVLAQWYCVFLILFGVPVYYVLYHAALARNVGMAILGTCMAGMPKLAWGIVPAYLCERFPTGRRAAGVGFGYSSGALLGAWFGAYVWWAHKIPAIARIEGQDLWLSPAVILTIGSAMTFMSLPIRQKRKTCAWTKWEQRENGSDLPKEANPNWLDGQKLLSRSS